MKSIVFAASMTCLVALTACGGGGGDSSAQTSPQAAASYPLRAAYKALIQSGSVASFDVTGTCAGSSQITQSPSIPASFEGVAGNSSTVTQTLTFPPSCTALASTAVTGVSYFDGNFTPIGNSTPGSSYARYQALPTALPESAKVGDTAIVGTISVYTDASKTTLTGQRSLSFVIEAGAGGDVVANAIGRETNLSGQLVSTQQTRHKLTAAGVMSVQSITIQTGTTTLTLTRK